MIDYEDYFVLIQSEAGEAIEKYTVKLFFNNEKKEPEPLACAVLVKTKLNYYLLSAAHAFLDNDIKKISILININEEITLGGQLLITRNINQPKKFDFEIAILKLDEITINNFNSMGKSFFDITLINTDMTSNPDEFFIVYGYPNTRVKLNKIKHSITYRAYNFLTKIANIELKKYDSKSLLKLSFTKNKTFNLASKMPTRAPKMTGISGTGIWSIPQILYNRGKMLNPLLRGIFVEYLKDRSIIVTVQLNSIVKALIENFQEDLKFPTSLK